MKSILLIGVLAFGQPDPQQQLQSAIHKEMVSGDLAGAAADYRSFLAAQNGKTRAMAAQAMWHLAECQEKLGDRNAAQRAYLRISREYADQSEASLARDKLFHWMEPLAGPRNLSFEKGELGKLPPGWFSRSAELARSGCRSRACAIVEGPSELSQSFGAATYRGKTVRLRASVRVESSESAQIWIRVERANRQAATFNAPAVGSPAWTQSEFSADIDDDAQTLTLGVTVAGNGRAWFDGISFMVADSDPETNRARTALQKIYDTDGRAKFKSVRLNGAEAIVTARREDASSVFTLRETWNRSGSGWKLADSKVAEVQPRAVPTSPEQARAVAAELRDRAVSLGVVEDGQTFYDLAAEGFAAFAKSAGEARTVVLGGDREVLALKCRLAESLIDHGAFSNIAIEAEVRGLNRYIQTGQGDAQSAVASLGPEWNVPEFIEFVRWMRAFAKSRGRALRFSRLEAALGEGIVWSDNDLAARMRGAGVFSVGVVVHRGPGEASVLSGARVPLLYLDLRSVSPESDLGRWLAAPHAFEGERVEVLSKSYDGLIFMDLAR